MQPIGMLSRSMGSRFIHGEIARGTTRPRDSYDCWKGGIEHRPRRWSLSHANTKGDPVFGIELIIANDNGGLARSHLSFDFRDPGWICRDVHFVALMTRIDGAGSEDRCADIRRFSYAEYMLTVLAKCALLRASTRNLYIRISYSYRKLIFYILT